MKKQIAFLLSVLMLSTALSGCGILNTIKEKVSPSEEQSSVAEETSSQSDAETSMPSQSKTPKNTALAEFRGGLDPEMDICAAAFFGTGESMEEFFETDAGRSLLLKYPFVEKIPEEARISAEGMEIYCVVPVDPQASISVYEYSVDESNNFEGALGELLYENSAGSPVLLRGNVSDIVPNLCVVIEDSAGNRLEYSPCLSGYDGSLSYPAVTEGPGVYDFTPKPAGFVGSWQQEVYSEEAGATMTCHLQFNADGSMNYWYGFPFQEIIEYFEGTYHTLSAEEEAAGSQYSAGDTIISMELTGGTALEDVESYEFWGVYSIVEHGGDTLDVTCLEGNSLLYNLTGTVSFVPAEE